MNENIIGILILYFIVTSTACGIAFPIMYDETFYSSYKSAKMEEYVFMGFLGLFFGWLVFPILLLVGIIRVIRRILERG